MKNKDYELILDALPGTGVYVLREDDHRVLYYNRRVKELAPELERGSVCRDICRGERPDCPLLFIGDQKEYRFVCYNGLFGKIMDVTAMRIMWEDEIPAYMIMVTPHVEALNYTYYMIVRGNLTTGSYEIVKTDRKEYEEGNFGGATFSEFLNQILNDGFVHPDDVERFRKYTDSAYLREEFQSGKELVSCTYRRRMNGVFRWYIMEVVPDSDYMQDHQTVRFYVKDVDDIYREGLLREEVHVRNQEVIKSLGEMNFGIFVIDLNTGFFETVRASDELRELSGGAEWDSGFETIRQKLIHPAYRGEVMENFTLSSLREHWRCGGEKVETVCQQITGGEYRYVSMTAHFYENRSRRGCVILAMQDVDERTRKDIRRMHSDRRMADIIRSRYGTMSVVHLDTGVCERFSLEQFGDTGNAVLGDYEYYIQKAGHGMVHEADQATFLEMFSLENLRKRTERADNGEEVVYQYRMKGEPVTWVEAHIFFRNEENSREVNILGRDITREKLREAADEQAKREREYIISCLGSMFFATYYMDLKHNTFRIVAQKDAVSRVLGNGMDYAEAIHTYAEQFVHPEDRKAYLETFSYENLRVLLRQNHPIVALEYRRITMGGDGDFAEDGWIRASVVLAEMEDGVPATAVYVAQDITETREKEERQHKALKDACDAANHASAAKSEFLSSMSHDIRTPMNAIIGMTTIAGTYLEDKERVSDCLNKITVASSHLLSLINEVLDMSKIESGTIELAEEKFSLFSLAASLQTMIRPAVEEKHHQIAFHIENVRHGDVIGDVIRLQQVCMNLLGNAVKYTPPGGELEMRISEQMSKNYGYGCYEFVFQDNGIGMDEEFCRKIFEPFSRAEDSRISKIEGTGLGMAIVQNIVRMMNGNILVESEPGRGSRFTVTIFLKQQKAEEGQLSGLPGSAEEESRGSGPQEEAQDQSFTGRGILLAEDNELNREIAEEIIGATGVTLESVTNGKEAVEQFERMEEGYYDLIFMDIQMPVMNGYEASRAIRAADRADAKTIPVIAMTANAFAEDVLASREAGMNEHISKPLSLEQLLACMARWLGRD